MCSSSRVTPTWTTRRLARHWSGAYLRRRAIAWASSRSRIGGTVSPSEPWARPACSLVSPRATWIRCSRTTPLRDTGGRRMCTARVAYPANVQTMRQWCTRRWRSGRFQACPSCSAALKRACAAWRTTITGRTSCARRSWRTPRPTCSCTAWAKWRWAKSRGGWVRATPTSAASRARRGCWARRRPRRPVAAMASCCRRGRSCGRTRPT